MTPLDSVKVLAQDMRQEARKQRRRGKCPTRLYDQARAIDAAVAVMLGETNLAEVYGRLLK